MRESAGELADRFHLLRLAQLLLGRELVGQIAADDVEQLAVGHRVPHDRAHLAGSRAEMVDEAGDRLTRGEARDDCSRRLVVVGFDDVEERFL